eukprot:scaffold1879_cov203-Pinguiococcus_pyrenoidosus.AAC.1
MTIRRMDPQLPEGRGQIEAATERLATQRHQARLNRRRAQPAHLRSSVDGPEIRDESPLRLARPVRLRHHEGRRAPRRVGGLDDALAEHVLHPVS